MNIYVRLGEKCDASQAVDVIRQSILQLCKADHHENDTEISGWLANKNISTWLSWVERKDAFVLVAQVREDIVGVGMMDLKGNILLNYVRPDFRFKGVSKALLSELEFRARSLGLNMCFVESTLTAKTFYKNNGYEDAGNEPFQLCKKLE